MNTIVILTVLAAALVLAIGLAFVPMRLLLTHMAANIRQFILRQRDRRAARIETRVSRVSPGLSTEHWLLRAASFTEMGIAVQGSSTTA